MKRTKYRNYSQLTLTELEEMVDELENMSIVALKNKRKGIRITILKTAKEVKKEIEKRLKK